MGLRVKSEAHFFLEKRRLMENNAHFLEFQDIFVRNNFVPRPHLVLISLYSLICMISKRIRTVREMTFLCNFINSITKH